MSAPNLWPFTHPKHMKCFSLQDAKKTMPRAETAVTGQLPPPLRYTRAQPSPHSRHSPPGVRGAPQDGESSRWLPGSRDPIAPGAPCPRRTARHNPSPPPLGCSPQTPLKLSPAACAHSFSPAGGKRALAPSVQRGRGGGQPAFPPPSRPGSPARRSLAEAPALHRRAVRGARRCPPAPRRRPRPRLAV